MNAPLKVLHFSDIHLEQGFRGVPLRSFANKRLTGYLNLAIRRRGHFANGPDKVRAIGRLAEEERVDVALCTGDYTALGTEPELAFARETLSSVIVTSRDYVTVPGNHDVYVQDAVDDERFERVFGDLLTTDLPEYATESGWPRVRLIDDGVAVVTLNSARPNSSVRLSSGRVPDAELEALARVLDAPELAGRFVFVATHYAPRLWNGRPDTRQHGLDNANDLLAVCKRISRGAICHGHVHRQYVVREPGVSAPIVCAGSATYVGREGLWLYEIGEDAAYAIRGRWNGERYELDRDDAVRLDAGA